MTTNIRIRLPELRVKIKSLAAEQRIIRREERRALDSSSYDRIMRRLKDASLTPAQIARIEKRSVRPRTIGLEEYHSLHGHRLSIRPSIRAALLAYAFLRGKSYASCERPGSQTPAGLSRAGFSAKIWANVQTFGGQMDPSAFNAWFNVEEVARVINAA